MSFHLWTLFLALIIDAIIGDPDWLWRKLPHPVVWIGNVIFWLDERFNKSTDSRKERRRKGLLVLIFLVFLGTLSGLALQFLINSLFIPWFFEALVVAIFLSSRSLYDHVVLVARKLDDYNLGPARNAVALIVGRDPKTLDRSGISRAAIESLAENYSDGVIAPALWYLIAGLPGLIVYKMVNTADSMIGHKTSRYHDFGRTSALFDDLINVPASRITAMLCILGVAIHHGTLAAKNAYSSIRRDAAKHRSPNAGWPEAAIAGGLGIALSGPRTYGGKRGDEAWINESGRQQLGPADISSSLTIYISSLSIFAGIIGFFGIIF